MDVSNILILNMERYDSYSNFYYLSQQKSQFILGELKWRLTESIQVILESLGDEEPIWRITKSWYWTLKDTNYFLLFTIWVSKNLEFFWLELKQRQTKPIQLKWETIVHEEPIWRLLVFRYWTWKDMNQFLIFSIWVSKNFNLF